MRSLKLLLLLLRAMARAQQRWAVLPPKLLASDGAEGDRFGSSVAVSDTFAVVGAKKDQLGSEIGSNIGSGSAYIYEQQPDGAWQEVQKLVASTPGADDSFGRSVSISGMIAVIGAFNVVMTIRSVGHQAQQLDYPTGSEANEPAVPAAE